MKTLRRFVAVLPLLFMTSCDLLNNFLNPKLPDPIKPNTNHSPRANLVINPESGYSPLITNILLNGTDEDNDSMGYQVKIDNNADGTIDETIPTDGSFSNTPIDITRTFTTGNSIVYGTVQDARGLKSERNIEVIVSEPPISEPGLVNKLPTANLFVSPSSGQYPLTTNISLNGTDSDGIVVGYKLEIDVGEDGTIDETIPSDGSFSNSQISVNKIFNSVGNARIYGIVKDDKSGETKTSKEISALERTDLTAKIDFSPSYKVGDKFNFSAEVQNNTANEITVTNSSASPNLEYRLIKENGTLIFDKKFPYDFLIKLHEMGTIKLSYHDTTVTTTVSNVYIESEKMKGDILPRIFLNGLSLNIPDPGEELKEAGNYYLQTIAGYSMNGNNYQVTLNSEQFSVSP